MPGFVQRAQYSLEKVDRSGALRGRSLRKLEGIDMSHVGLWRHHCKIFKIPRLEIVHPTVDIRTLLIFPALLNERALSEVLYLFEYVDLDQTAKALIEVADGIQLL